MTCLSAAGRGCPLAMVGFLGKAFVVDFVFALAQIRPARYMSLAAKIVADGWSMVGWPDASDLLQLVAGLGAPVPSRFRGALVDRLAPLERHQGRLGSMSAHYGKGEFPFHTDTASFPMPPRYVALRLAPGHASKTPSLVVDWQRLAFTESERKVLANDVWFVFGGRGHFYTPILNFTRVANRSLIRFDQCCMRPGSSFTARAADILHARLEGGAAERSRR
jgi:hypothetical protein